MNVNTGIGVVEATDAGQVR